MPSAKMAPAYYLIRLLRIWKNKYMSVAVGAFLQVRPKERADGPEGPSLNLDCRALRATMTKNEVSLNLNFFERCVFGYKGEVLVTME